MEAQPRTSEAPRLGGVRFGPTLAGALYLLLVASAALALWARGSTGRQPALVSQVAPWVFLGFVVLFALYRFGLVRAQRYPAFKAFFQVGAGLLFFLLLLPGTRLDFARPQSELDALLQDPNPAVRAVAAEVARYRADGKAAAPELARALDDRDARVRAQAHQSLVKLTGEDLGPPEDPKAVQSWRERYP